MITHELTDIPKKIDRVVMIRDGKIYADGKKSELLNDKDVSALYGENIVVESTDGIYRMHMV
jgi:iron complex transport system ATP-binding protein